MHTPLATHTHTHTIPHTTYITHTLTTHCTHHRSHHLVGASVYFFQLFYPLLLPLPPQCLQIPNFSSLPFPKHCCLVPFSPPSAPQEQHSPALHHPFLRGKTKPPTSRTFSALSSAFSPALSSASTLLRGQYYYCHCRTRKESLRANCSNSSGVLWPLQLPQLTPHILTYPAPTS